MFFCADDNVVRIVSFLASWQLRNAHLELGDLIDAARLSGGSILEISDGELLFLASEVNMARWAQGAEVVLASGLAIGMLLAVVTHILGAKYERNHEKKIIHDQKAATALATAGWAFSKLGEIIENITSLKHNVVTLEQLETIDEQVLSLRWKHWMDFGILVGAMICYFPTCLIPRFVVNAIPSFSSNADAENHDNFSLN